MADVGDSVSNPQSPVNGILDDPLTLDFDPMSFQLPSSPTSSPEDPPFVNEPPAANDTNYKYNPKSYLLDLDSIQRIQETTERDSPEGPDDTPDLLVDLGQGSTPKASIPEEDLEEDLSDPKTEEDDDDSKELDLSAGSESTSSFVAECLSPTTVANGTLEGLNQKDASPVQEDLPKTSEDAGPLEANTESAREAATSPNAPSPGREEEPATCRTPSPATVVPPEDPERASSPQESESRSPYTVSSPVDETDSTATPCTYRETTPGAQSPLDKPWSPALDVSDMELDMDTPSPTPVVEEPSSPKDLEDQPRDDGVVEELTECVFTSTYKCMTAQIPDTVHENGTEDEEECCKGTPRTEVRKSGHVVSTASKATKEGKVVVEERSTSKSEISTHGSYDALNGLADRHDLTNEADHAAVCPAADSPVSVSKLKDAYRSPDDREEGNAFREVAVTGISLVSLKSQYEQSVAESLSPSREAVNTGVDIQTLKCSYSSPVNGTLHGHPSPCEDLVPVDIELLKSSFSSDVVRSTPLEEVKVDKAKLQKKFDKVKPEDSSSTCRRCSGLVYPVERVKAEKNAYHKNCFRCKECNKLLSIDTYQSHEAEIYCRVHFKQLFQPKARFDNDAGPTSGTVEAVDSIDEGRQRRHEMIIRENVPEELPPDVVRCNTKVDDGLGHLSLDLRNIKQQFESPHEFVPSVSDRSALARSESLVKRLEKYQCAASGDRNGTVDTLESEEEENGEDSPVTKHGKAKEKVVVFEGLSSLKSQWETGKVSGHHQDEDREDVKEELAKLRKKMCLGRSESMRQVYQRAVGDASRSPVSGRSEAVTLEGHEVRATSVKEKFEAGALDRESEAEKIERLAREKQEELSVFSEAGIAHEAKNIFKQLDAEVAKQATSPTPTSLARSPSNRWSQPKPPPTEVVRSSDPVQDVEVETTELSERFKFFENYKEGSKERKRFEITPPREVREPSPDAPIRRDPDVVRAADPAEEIVVTDTARRMRERFRELEENAGKRELPQGPKPLKRITPPREYTVDDREESPEVVKCSYKTEEEVVVEADRTKSMRARFENWESAVARENRKNGTAEEDEEEYLPVADTAKNLRAKFEAIKDDAVRQEADRRKAKVNRFVEFPGTPPTDACNVCGKKLYPMERMEASGLRLHKNCFRCSHCSCHLRLENYTVSGGKLFCTPHFRQFFIAKGNYDEGFGREKWSRSTSPASREGTEDYTNTTNGRLGALDRPITA